MVEGRRKQLLYAAIMVISKGKSSGTNWKNDENKNRTLEGRIESHDENLSCRTLDIL
uniref:Uncharacterized protein n=1 Tax=Romanomermis culicivorax TaxID=13658 RepID=A0A915K9E7_ROMCU